MLTRSLGVCGTGGVALNREVKYVAFYSSGAVQSENRQSSPSAITKIDYICSALRRNGVDVEIVSPSWTNNGKGVYRGGVYRVAEGVTLRTFRTFGAGNRLQRIVKYLYSLSQMCLYLLGTHKKGEPIIVYHSPILSLPIRLVQRVKRFELILEVEEIYQDVVACSRQAMRSEYRIFASADKFILSTGLLNDKVNPGNKPNAVVHGVYRREPDRKCGFDDDRIHVVYAGTFNPSKGAAAAAAAAAYLPTAHYHVHIIGFGNEAETERVRQQVAEISRTSGCTVTYDGLLRGEEYIRFLQSCDIGLSTQIPDTTYNDTSFPSKILSYLANGLRVVSVRTRAIESSAIGDVVFYYEEQTPRAIAEAIMSIDMRQPYDSTELMNRLDAEFVKSVKQLVCG